MDIDLTDPKEAYRYELGLAGQATERAIASGSKDDHTQAATAWRKARHSALSAGLQEEARKADTIATRHANAAGARS